MSKVIEVHDCRDCPYASKTARPICMNEDVSEDVTVWDIPKTGIADFCPLDDAEDFAESNFDIDRKD